MTQLPVAVIDSVPALRHEDPLPRPVSNNVFCYPDTCNVYLIRDGSQALAIDFGAGDVLDELEGLGIERLTDILVTHHHRDQVQGLHRAVAAGIRIWVPLNEQDLFTSIDAHWQARTIENNYNNRQDRYSLLEDVPISGVLTDYASFRRGDLALQVIPTPGHTPGSISLLTEIDGQTLAFTGDLLSGPGKVWSLAATQWTYNGAEGVPATMASLLDLKARRPGLLLPSHGAPIPEPDAAIELTVERLGRLLDLRREPSNISDLRARPYERVTPHLLRNRTSHSTSYVVLSESGKALLIDFGYDFTRGLASGSDRASRRPWLYTIDALKRDFGVRTIEAVIPTHYHDDHVAGCNLLREVEGSRVWAAASFADVLERPENYDLPCLWYEPVPVDRRLPTGEAVGWEEYQLTLHDQPGHTQYAVAIELTVDDTRVLFIGDQMGHADGLDLNYVYAGGFRVDDYRQSAELYRDLQPDLLLSGHWQPLRSGLSHLVEVSRRSASLAQLHRELLPLDDLDLEASGPVARVRPYRLRARGGHAFELDVEVRNPARTPADVRARLVAPGGWLVQPSEAIVGLGLGERGSLRFKLVAPPGLSARRSRIGVDVTVGSRRLGQVVEALIDLV